MTKKKVLLKIGAGLLAFVLIFQIFVFMNSLIGNPISAFIAKNAAAEYVDQKYQSFHFDLGKTRYNFKFGEYYVNAVSTTSQDTHFTITYHRGGKISDDFAYRVLSKENTARRFQETYEREISGVLNQMKSMENVQIRVSAITMAYDGLFEELLMIDMPFDKTIPIPYSIMLDGRVNELSFETINEVCQEVNQLMDENNCPYFDLWVDFEGENFSVYNIRKTDIESGRLIELLQENFQGQENEWAYNSFSLHNEEYAETKEITP